MLIEYHRTLINDHARNQALYEALRRLIRPGESVVSDIGAGSGLLSLMAAKLGAKEVYAYEYGGIADVAEALIAENGFKNIHLIRAHSTEMIDPPPSDIVISETLGNYAYEEHILETLMDTRRFLKPGGVMVPQRIAQYVAPVTAPELSADFMVWQKAGGDFGLTLGAAERYSLNNIYVRNIPKAALLDAGHSARKWEETDLSDPRPDALRRARIDWPMNGEGMIYGFGLWWDCVLLPGLMISTAPDAPATHWEQLYLPLEQPLKVRNGDTLSLSLEAQTTPEDGTVIGWETELRRGGKSVISLSQSLRKGYVA